MIAHLCKKCPVAENGLEGCVFLETWEQERRKNLVSLSLAGNSKHLLNVDNRSSVITGIGKVFSRKLEYVSSDATQFLDFVRTSISDALMYL